MRNCNFSRVKFFINSIPNAITISRIFFTVIFSYCVFEEKLLAALIFFALASISDFLDGYLARAFKVVSKFGAMLDPVADKILIFVAYFSLCLQKYIPTYLAATVILRDILILAAVIFCLRKKIDLQFSPLWSSKINTTVQMLYVIIVLVYHLNHVEYPQWMLTSATAVVFITTVFSGAEYAEKYRGILQKLFK